MRLFEGAIFLSIATGLHMGVWIAAPMPDGADASGDAGQSSMTIAPASASMAQMVQRWQSPPSAVTDMVQTPAPVTPTPAALPAPAPDRAMPHRAIPDRPSMPQATQAPRAQETPPAAPRTAPMTALAQPIAPDAQDTVAPTAQQPSRPPAPQPPQLVQPDTATAPQADTQPATPQPKRAPAKATTQPSAPQPKAQAQGAPAKKPATSGSRGTQQAAAAQTAQTTALQAQWGARIQRKIHRNLFYPRGASGSGTARVALTVDRNGRLQSVRLTRSSGVAAFDKAALSAVRRAGRFARAPSGLTNASYSFTMGLNFKP